ncbi:Surfactin synthase thioesterase subunit [Pseudoduganella namucuonensis]|uniref:Surfactin synthase thioesterase subunit n=2 Tax=Pseudoduganella namucuonensis TaxID=1035707 RepID=A0A1I7FK94_9BURK|nr:Surfactin synthase thioesterase subunit [Pseudoduganella namucuonensis]
MTWTMSKNAYPIKLYCFPYAGGNASVFRAWQRLLPSHIQVAGVELPGHGVRMSEPLVDDFHQLVRSLALRLAADFKAESARKPGLRFAMFGHSAGAALALAVAAALEQMLETAPMRCFLCACGHFGAPKQSRSHLSDAALTDELRRLGGTPAQVLDHPDLLAMVLPILRADFRVHEQSIHQRGLLVDYPFTLLAARDDAVRPDDVWGWQNYTTASCRQVLLRGGHFFPMQEPAELISHLRADLDQSAGCRPLPNQPFPCELP